MPRPFAVIGFTVFFTIALLFKFTTGVTVAAIAVIFVALVIVLLIKSLRKSRVIPCALASSLIACLLFSSYVQFLYLPAVSYKGKTCDISAVLISEPEYEYGNCYYIARAKSIDSEEVDLKLRLVFSSVPDAEPYDEIYGRFTFYVPGESNDASLSSNISNGIFIAAYPHNGDFEVISIPEHEKPFGKTIIDIRTEIKNAVYRVLPNEYGALAVALLIGDKSGLSSETLHNFSFIGISHIICVSGYHLSLWSMLFYELLIKTKLNKRISSLVCVVPVVLFMFISGMTYSVIRAGIMMIIYLLSNVFLRKRDPLNSLGFALTVIAAFNPFAMGSASLQLSALATAGIIIFSDCFADKSENMIGKIKYGFVRKTIRSVVSVTMVTFAATAFTLPVSLLLYNRFNFAFFIANLIVVPISGFCMVLCALGALTGCFTTSIINVPAYFGGLLSRFLLWFSKSLSDFKFLAFNVEKDETYVIIISVFLICIFAVLLAYYGKSFPGLTCVICSLLFVVNLIFFSVSERKNTDIIVADCGNGTSVVLTKGEETVLLGCGGNEFRGYYNLCSAIDITGNDLKAVVFPDADTDSSSYFVNVIKEFRPATVYCDSHPESAVPLLKNTGIFGFEYEKEFDNFDIVCETLNEKSFAMIKNEDVSVLILFDPVDNINILPYEFRKADVIISRNDYPHGIENSDSVLVIINSVNNRGINIQNELECIGINSAATAGCGTIRIKADDGCISSYREI